MGKGESLRAGGISRTLLFGVVTYTIPLFLCPSHLLPLMSAHVCASVRVCNLCIHGLSRLWCCVSKSKDKALDSPPHAPGPCVLTPSGWATKCSLLFELWNGATGLQIRYSSRWCSRCFCLSRITSKASIVCCVDGVLRGDSVSRAQPAGGRGEGQSQPFPIETDAGTGGSRTQRDGNALITNCGG